ncbi:MAG: class I SAM-dependent methyltransferase [Betaproteobacteria bacterium]|nr:class I SAM-dependent methyltransferase [Betaproteobacteria bacterium]
MKSVRCLIAAARPMLAFVGNCVLCFAGVTASSFAPAGHAQPAPTAPPALRAPDVRYDPTAPAVVRAMLRLGQVSARDVVYDLGCGDGRIVIAAVRERGARGVCVDIDPRRIAESRENARAADVADRIEFRNEDLFATEIGAATVVMLFLYPDLNLKLRPRLLSHLKPGTRIVSHWHDMGDWKPLETVRVVSEGRARPIYLWTIPQR